MKGKIDNSPRTLFPLSKAKGRAFCNRHEETHWLSENILSGKHSIIIAPRRYGKSSLADKVIHTTRLPAVILNFNTCADSDDVENVITWGVSQLIGKALGSVDKLMASLRRYLTHLTPKIIVDAKGASLELVSAHSVSAVVRLEESLSMLEKLLKEKQQHAVMIFDEFQTVGLIAKGKGVESALRNVIQELEYITIVFSGSRRHLLQIMFDDDNRPLYKLCRKLHLGRIEAQHYEAHLSKAAKLQWQAPLDVHVVSEILKLSERHPFYLNYLCDIIWSNTQHAPTIKDVKNAWQQLIKEEYSDAQAEIASCSMGQKKVLKAIAQKKSERLLSAEMVKHLSVATSSIATSIKALIERDVIEKAGERYQIINPVVRSLLQDNLLR